MSAKSSSLLVFACHNWTAMPIQSAQHTACKRQRAIEAFSTFVDSGRVVNEVKRWRKDIA